MAGCDHVSTVTKAFATGLDARQDDYNKGRCSHVRSVNNPIRYDNLEDSFPLKLQVVFDFLNLKK